MLHTIKYALLTILMAALGACSSKSSFSVEGTLADGASINLRLVYYVGDAVHTGLVASTDGHFEFSASAPEMAAVEVYDNDYRLLARFAATDGDHIKLRIDRSNMYRNTASGNELNKAITEFYNANADILAGNNTDERNRLIADYVDNHSASPVAQFLLVTEFDAFAEDASAQADSLMSTLAPEARAFAFADGFARLSAEANASTDPIAAVTFKARGNKTETFITGRQARSVIVISAADRGRDSVLQTIRQIAKKEKDGKLAILDLSVDADTMIWTRSIKNDSATWKQGWAAGSISGQSLGRMAVPAVPYFIIVDSAGHQIWRGRQASELLKNL